MRRLSRDMVIEKFQKVHGDRYDYMQTNYVNMRTKVPIKCRIHGTFWQLPYDHIKGCGCPKCHPNTVPMTTASFIEKAQDVHGQKYCYSKVNYKKSQQKVCIICPIHGEFWQTPNNHLNGQGCPICSESKGEKLIEGFLKNSNIQYVRQYCLVVPNEIRETGKIFVDFYLPEHNAFIEYNGKQHYIPVDYFGGKLTLQAQEKRDTYLRQYCKQNSISLLEIKFDRSQDEIKSLISNFIKT